jgi:hypothetical protein
MVDIANLVLKIDSQGVVTASRNLAEMAKTGEQAEGVTEKLQSRIGKMVAGALTIGSVVGAFKALASAAMAAEQAFFEGERAEAKLNAVLKSTGGAAGVTSGSMMALAAEIQRTTGMCDDLVLNSEAVLLTFTRIGSDVFPQAVRAAADMSAVLGQDMQSSVTMLGKALNDPIAGITALGRAGVQFTEDQKAQIKVMVEAGDVFGAQTIILREMQTEYGGAAVAMGDTASGAAMKLKEAMEDLQKAFGENVAQGMQPFREWLTRIVTAAAAAMEKTSALKKALMEGLTETVQPMTLLVNALAKVDEGLAALDKYGTGSAQARRMTTEAKALEGQRVLILQQIRNLERVAEIEREQAPLKAKAAQEAKDLADYLARVAEEYEKTEEGKLAALQKEIGYWESMLPSAVATKSQVQAILAALREQLPIQKEIAGLSWGAGLPWADYDASTVLDPMVEDSALLARNFEAMYDATEQGVSFAESLVQAAEESAILDRNFEAMYDATERGTNEVVAMKEETAATVDYLKAYTTSVLDIVDYYGELVPQAQLVTMTVREATDWVDRMADGTATTYENIEKISKGAAEGTDFLRSMGQAIEGDLVGAFTSLLGMLGPEGAIAAQLVTAATDMFSRAFNFDQNAEIGRNLSEGLRNIFASAIAEDDWSNVREALYGQIRNTIIETVMKSALLQPYIDEFTLRMKQWVNRGTDASHDRMMASLQALVNAGNRAGNIVNEIIASSGLSMLGDTDPSVVGFARGGVVTSPTVFPMARGMGLMGESGPEAVLPLVRIGGDLGVRSTGGGTTVVVHNHGSVIQQREFDASVIAAVGRSTRGH